MNNKILVLGKTGMLGSMVCNYLKVGGTDRSTFDAEKFIYSPNDFAFIKSYDYVINCIGIIKPYCKDDDETGIQRAIKVNALFPHCLANYLLDSNTKVIQIATDCVFSGREGNYSEESAHDPIDVYGRTKSLGEVNGNAKFLNIRCSIVGPEKKSHLSLLDWFLNQPSGSVLNGFSHHMWNGVTTLQFAKLCQKIIETNKFDELVKISTIHHFVPNSGVSKYELLSIFKRVFRKDYIIREVDNVGPAINRTLVSKFNLLEKLYPSQAMEAAIKELADYMKV